VSLARRTWDFLKVRKRYWLLPAALIVVAMTAFIALTDISIGVPYIYNLF